MKDNNRRRDTIDPVQPHPHSWDDLIGKKHGRLVAVGFTGIKTKFNQKLVTCQCECGGYIGVPANSLRTGNTQSCGCFFSEVVSKRNAAAATHGHSTNGIISEEYRAWQNMLSRCSNPKDPRYVWYGARGISVWAEWTGSFQAFFDHVGPKPSTDHSLDRIDNNGNYAPGNVRWATIQEQNRNRRVTLYFTLHGVTKSLPDWAEGAGIAYDTVRQRLAKGWTISHALGTPIGRSGPISKRVDWEPPKT